MPQDVLSKHLIFYQNWFAITRKHNKMASGTIRIFIT